MKNEIVEILRSFIDVAREDIVQVAHDARNAWMVYGYPSSEERVPFAFCAAYITVVWVNSKTLLNPVTVLDVFQHLKHSSKSYPHSLGRNEDSVLEAIQGRIGCFLRDPSNDYPDPDELVHLIDPKEQNWSVLAAVKLYALINRVYFDWSIDDVRKLPLPAGRNVKKALSQLGFSYRDAKGFRDLHLDLGRKLNVGPLLVNHIFYLMGAKMG